MVPSVVATVLIHLWKSDGGNLGGESDVCDFGLNGMAFMSCRSERRVPLRKTGEKAVSKSESSLKANVGLGSSSKSSPIQMPANSSSTLQNLSLPLSSDPSRVPLNISIGYSE